MTDSPRLQEFKNPEFQSRIRALRQTDNVTNWFYLAREYLFLGIVIGLTVAFYHNRADWGLAWGWNVPITFLATILVGLGQHRLMMLAHEATHHLLFRSRKLNDLVSDWFCLFPVLSTTYLYRRQHLAHHQYVNDPERDPDHAYMQVVGYRFDYPMPRWRFLWDCIIKLFFWFPLLVRYIFIRAKLAALGSGTRPTEENARAAKTATVMNVCCLVAVIAVLIAGGWWENRWLLALGPPSLLLLRLAFSTVAKPPDGAASERWADFQRLVYLSMLFTVLAWLQHLTGRHWPLYYVLLWLVPLGTSFSFFMILREEIQHSNMGRGLLDHTRNFQGNRLFRSAVLPMNENYHLDHHLFAMVPHYRLEELNSLLVGTRVFRDNLIVVDGYLFGRPAPATP